MSTGKYIITLADTEAKRLIDVVQYIIAYYCSAQYSTVYF